MKKILLQSAVLAIAGILIACHADVERVYPATYVYQNNCSDSIIIKVYSHNIDYNTIPIEQKTGKVTFRIKQGDSIALSGFMAGFFNELPLWGSVNGKDSTIVVMGNKQIVYRIWIDDAIYNPSKYAIISDASTGHIILGWTFTDADFADAEIIDTLNNNQ